MSTRSRWRRRPSPIAVDRLVAVLLAASVVATAGGEPRATAAGVVAAIVVAASVAFRRSSPAVLVLVFAASAVGGRGHVDGLIALPIAFGLHYYLVGRRSAEGASRAVTIAFLLLPTVLIALSPNTSRPGDALIVDVVSVWLFFFGLPFVVGRAVADRHRLSAALRANSERLVAAQRVATARAAAEERVRIARELHDVIAHSVSVMVIQTGAARAVAGNDPDAALEALRAVEGCGREALVELRRMIGVLHRDDGDLLGDATPGVAQLGRLVTRAQLAGLPVELRIDGRVLTLPPALDLVAYRLVQESLTNAIKHAGQARARVTVTFSPSHLDLDIVDTGSGTGTAPATSGQGLIGMRERLALYGGHLETGTRRQGGYRVHARVPLPSGVGG